LKYLAYMGLPILLQAGFTYLIIHAAPGGSFVGLGALLFAGFGIPDAVPMCCLTQVKMKNRVRSILTRE